MKKRRVLEIILLTLVFLNLLLILSLLTDNYLRNEIEEDRDDIIEDDESIECLSDSECVPASCCHSNSCTSVKNTPNCNGIFCTQVCQPGSLDCGQARCSCIKNKCMKQ